MKHNIVNEDLLGGELKSEGVNMAPGGNNVAVCKAFGNYMHSLNPTSISRFGGGGGDMLTSFSIIGGQWFFFIVFERKERERLKLSQSAKSCKARTTNNSSTRLWVVAGTTLASSGFTEQREQQQQIPPRFPAIQKLTLTTRVPDEVVLSAEVLFLRRVHYGGVSGVDGPQHTGFPFEFDRQRFDLALFEQLQRDLAGDPVAVGENVIWICRRLVRDAETSHGARHVASGGRAQTTAGLRGFRRGCGEPAAHSRAQMLTVNLPSTIYYVVFSTTYVNLS